jgi:hypothetical protein
MAGRHRKPQTRPRFGLFGAAAVVMAGGALCINAYGTAPVNYVPLALTPSQAGPPLSRVQSAFTNSLIIQPATEQVTLVQQARQQVVQPVVHVEKIQPKKLETHHRARSTRSRSEHESSKHSGRHSKSSHSDREEHSHGSSSSHGRGVHSGGHSSHGGFSGHGGFGGGHSGSHSGSHDSGGSSGGSSSGGDSGGSSGGSSGGDSGSSGGTTT